MTDNSYSTPLVIRIATPEDIELIEMLDSLSEIPYTRYSSRNA